MTGVAERRASRVNLNVAARQVAASIGMVVQSRETIYGEGPLCVEWYLAEPGKPFQGVRLCLGVVSNYGAPGWYGQASLENLPGTALERRRSVMLVDPAQGLSAKASRKQAQEQFFAWAERCLAKSVEAAARN